MQTLFSGNAHGYFRAGAPSLRTPGVSKCIHRVREGGESVLKRSEVPRATLGRLPSYLKYLKNLPQGVQTISAPSLAKGLELGEVQVRKDLSLVSGAGKPKIGYNTAELIESLEEFLGWGRQSGAIIVGAGKLGRALLDYHGFAEYGLEILAAFDSAVAQERKSESGKLVLPIQRLEAFCRDHFVKIGIITVPAAAAQSVCDLLVQNKISAIWCFAPCQLILPESVPIQYENMALSLAYLNKKIEG